MKFSKLYNKLTLEDYRGHSHHKMYNLKDRNKGNGEL